MLVEEVICLGLGRTDHAWSGVTLFQCADAWIQTLKRVKFVACRKRIFVEGDSGAKHIAKRRKERYETHPQI